MPRSIDDRRAILLGGVGVAVALSGPTLAGFGVPAVVVSSISAAGAMVAIIVVHAAVRSRSSLEFDRDSLRTMFEDLGAKFRAAVDRSVKAERDLSLALAERDDVRSLLAELVDAGRVELLEHAPTCSTRSFGDSRDRSAFPCDCAGDELSRRVDAAVTVSVAEESTDA